MSGGNNAAFSMQKINTLSYFPYMVNYIQTSIILNFNKKEVESLCKLRF